MLCAALSWINLHKMVLHGFLKQTHSSAWTHMAAGGWRALTVHPLSPTKIALLKCLHGAKGSKGWWSGECGFQATVTKWQVDGDILSLSRQGIWWKDQSKQPKWSHSSHHKAPLSPKELFQNKSVSLTVYFDTVPHAPRSVAKNSPFASVEATFTEITVHSC